MAAAQLSLRYSKNAANKDFYLAFFFQRFFLIRKELQYNRFESRDDCTVILSEPIKKIPEKKRNLNGQKCKIRIPRLQQFSV